MKEKIHPVLHEVNVHCVCGHEFKSRSTKKEMRVEVCAECHPFYTGRQREVKVAGRVERFQQKYAKLLTPEAAAPEVPAAPEPAAE